MTTAVRTTSTRALLLLALLVATMLGQATIGASTAEARPRCVTRSCDVAHDARTNVLYAFDHRRRVWFTVQHAGSHAMVGYYARHGWVYLGSYRYGRGTRSNPVGGRGSGFTRIGTLGTVPTGVGHVGAWATSAVQQAFNAVQGVPTICGTGQCPKGLGR